MVYLLLDGVPIVLIVVGIFYFLIHYFTLTFIANTFVFHFLLIHSLYKVL